MKYLVTGSTGLLGNNVVRELLAGGHRVRVLTRQSSDPRPLAGLDVEQAIGDVRDAASVAAACDGVDAVVHSAAHVHIGWTQADLARAINVDGARNVAVAARTSGAKLVHVSTINTLGLGRPESPGDEDHALPGAVPCPYVLTKREGERMVLDEVERGLHASIVLPSLMIGPWDWKPSTGQMFLAVARGTPSAPTGWANYCDVRDVAQGIITASQRGEAGRRYILGGVNDSYMKLWKMMAKVANSLQPRLPMGPLFRIFFSITGDAWTKISGKETSANSAALRMSAQTHCFSSARAERELDYRCRPLQESLVDAWNWLVEYGYSSRKKS